MHFVCSQYLCNKPGLAQGLEALQCADGIVELLMCGVDVRNPASDYSGVQIDWLGIFEYPRQLTSNLWCTEPFDCAAQCGELENEGRAPPACTYCSTPVRASPLPRFTLHLNPMAYKATLPPFAVSD